MFAPACRGADGGARAVVVVITLVRSNIFTRANVVVLVSLGPLPNLEATRSA